MPISFGYTSATATYPITVPLQAGVMGVMTPNPENTSVKVRPSPEVVTIDSALQKRRDRCAIDVPGKIGA